MSQLVLTVPASAGGAGALPEDALAAVLENAKPAEGLEEPPPAAKPASVSQEIWERKGWNSMDGSGFKPWGRGLKGLW